MAGPDPATNSSAVVGAFFTADCDGWCMQVHVVGDDPVREAVVAALGDVDVSITAADPDDLESARFAVVADVAGSETFDRANDAARAGGTPWIAVEIGGVGGHPLSEVDAAVSGYAPGTACFDCLRTRVTSHADDSGGDPTTDRATARLAGAVAGRECVRVLSGDDRTVLGHVVELPHRRRRVLPVPGCDCAESGRDRTLERDDESLALEAAVNHAEAAIDERVGIVEEIGEVESFPVPYYLATTADTTGYSDASAAKQAAGVADDWNTALMKAVGEAIERYCAGVYRDDDFVHASETDLENAISPASLVRPPNAPEYDPEAEHRWVAGERLATGESAYLPAAAVQFPQPGERLVPAITTGLGLGSSSVDALLSGLTEVLERDATMLAWYSTFEPLGLSVDDDRFDTLERRARSEGLSVTTMLVTQDVDVPVVTVAVHRDPAITPDPVDPESDDWPAFAVGSAAGLDATDAAISALEEALQNWMELRSLGYERASAESGEIGAYAAFPEVTRSFVNVDGTVPADSVGPDPVPTGLAALETVVDRVEDAGLEPYAARLTTRDVEAIGFEAVRVVVPGAQSLFTGEPYFGERAERVPAELGFEPRLERGYHPYP
ncbi:Ribosomal protein S12 methylthiotransferase accessory factor YcaO [Natrarchaeobaculum sulfurireducens]|uniref:Ribosomal protein S12 methylthiotransferase accessory factor YcaO n=2 Tax=Natrarchaeobaculum sulfurireducens TaxID=2044521 RepID=A0A346PEB2_9EURY|nr:Ribosomal protein S12 methylthiotransferase accessory factor YcaO [Natrarchaeobaculum sulfurireducens]